MLAARATRSRITSRNIFADYETLPFVLARDRVVERDLNRRRPRYIRKARGREIIPSARAVKLPSQRAARQISASSTK